MKKLKHLLLSLLLSLFSLSTFACSILYYIDSETGKIYFVNNEDYWYDVKAYIQIIPSSENELGRMWYGWDNFGQGGVNEKGLVIDGAVTPTKKIPDGYSNTKKGNITDEILATCSNVDDVIQYLEDKKIALNNAHIIIGDKKGDAVIIEWVNGEKKIIPIDNNRLIATNFNLSDTSEQGNTCWRYDVINQELDKLESETKEDSLKFRALGNVIAKAVQVLQENEKGKLGGTLYSSFIDITDMKLILVYKLDNSKIHKFDILNELSTGKKRKIKLR